MKSSAELDMVAGLADFLRSDENVIFAILFGSTAKGLFRKGSDLDVAISFREPPEGLEILAYIRSLSERAGRDVHLTILNSASALLRHQVMKYGRPITIKDRREYIGFREKTITDYQEYKYISGMNVYD